MKIILIFLFLGLAHSLSLDELDKKEFSCFINDISQNYIACENAIYKDNSKILDSADGIKFVDDYKGDILFISSNDGEKSLNLYKNNKLLKQKLAMDINKAFLSDFGIILISLASEIRVLDFNLKEQFIKHFNTASISAASMNNDRSKLALGFESGKVIIYDVKTKNLKEKDIHKDNIYAIDYKKALISCSTDRNAVIFDEDFNIIKTINNDNLVYICAISDDAKTYAYTCDDDNNICINNDKIIIENLYINSIEFNKNKLRINAYSDILYEKEF